MALVLVMPRLLLLLLLLLPRLLLLPVLLCDMLLLLLLLLLLLKKWRRSRVRHYIRLGSLRGESETTRVQATVAEKGSKLIFELATCC